MNGEFIGRNIDFLEDSVKNLTIDDMVTGKFDGRFKQSDSDVPSFGYTSSVYWVRFSVLNNSGKDITWFLEFANNLTNRVDVFVKKQPGIRKIATFGNMFINDRDIRHVTPNIRMTDGPGTTEYFMRVQTNVHMVLPIRIWTTETIIEHIKFTTAAMIVFYGIALVMLLYNFIIFTFTREKVYLFYVLNTLCIVSYSLLNDGYFFTYVIPYNFYIINVSYPFLFLIALTGTAFTREFLDTKNFMPSLDRWVIRPSLILYFVIALSFIPVYLAIRIWLQPINSPFMMVLNIILLACGFVMIAIGIVYLTRKIRPGYFYCVGYFSFLAGALSSLLREFSIIPTTTTTMYHYHIGVILMLVLFSVGLADYINVIRRKVMVLNTDLSAKNIALTRTNEELQEVNKEMEAQTEELADAYGRMEILARALDQADEEIIIANGKGIIQHVNPAFERKTGISYREVIGKDLRRYICDEHDETQYHRTLDIIQKGSPWRGQIVRVLEDGSIRHEDTTISPLKEKLGTVSSIVIIRRDETEQIKLQNQLIQAQKMDAMGTLVSGLAHDFNNILGGIIGSVSLLEIEIGKLHDGSNSDFLDYLGIIKSSSDRAADIIRRMLTLSRKNEPVRGPVSLNSALKNVLRICENSLPKCVRLDFRFSREPITVFADPVQLEQMILNLCINASHAMTIMKGGDVQGGELRVTASVSDSGDTYLLRNLGAGNDSPYALIEVSDQGVGISNENMDKLFEPFFSTKTRGTGTGLGLTIVSRIVSQHDGFIDVKTQLGEGTTMRVYMPLSTEMPRADDVAPFPILPGKGNGRILVIDDESSICNVIKSILREGGYDPVITTSPGKGLEIYEQEWKSFKLVILDMSMPELSGLEEYKRISSIYSRVPVLIISGFSHDERISRVIEMGAAGFLGKPFSAATLLDKVFSLTQN